MAEELVKLSSSEKTLLASILENGSRVDAIIPDRIEDPRRFMETLDVAVRLFSNLEAAGNKLKPVIGRMLYIIKKNPDLYKGKGYATFEKFCEGEIYGKYGISRSSLWEAKQLNETYPTLTLGDYAKAGVTKLLLAAKHIGKGGNVAAIVEKAKGMTITEFSGWISAQTNTNGHDRSGAVFSLTGNQNDIAEIRKFCADQEILEYCSCTTAAGVILALIAECSQQWRDSIEISKGR